MIEVAYGEIIFHSNEVVWEMVTRKEWLGCQHDALPMFDISGSTPVRAPYIYYFFDFHDIKAYIMFSKLYVV